MNCSCTGSRILLLQCTAARQVASDNLHCGHANVNQGQTPCLKPHRAIPQSYTQPICTVNELLTMRHLQGLCSQTCFAGSQKAGFVRMRSFSLSDAPGCQYSACLQPCFGSEVPGHHRVCAVWFRRNITLVPKSVSCFTTNARWCR